MFWSSKKDKKCLWKLVAPGSLNLAPANELATAGPASGASVGMPDQVIVRLHPFSFLSPMEHGDFLGHETVSNVYVWYVTDMKHLYISYSWYNLKRWRWKSHIELLPPYAATYSWNHGVDWKGLESRLAQTKYRGNLFWYNGIPPMYILPTTTKDGVKMCKLIVLREQLTW